MNAGTGKGRRIFFCKSSKCTLFHNLWDKGVAVYTGSFEWDKKKSRCCFPAVDCNAGNLFFKKLLSPWKVPWQAAVIFFNVIFFIGNTSFQIVT